MKKIPNESVYEALSLFDEEDGADPKATLRNLLTELRHYCADEGLDFDAAVLMSEFHFSAESDDADEEGGVEVISTAEQAMG